MSIPKPIIAEHPALGEWSILTAYRGSVAHGMYVQPTDPTSIDDKDVMVCCVPPIEYYFGLREFGSRGTQEIKRDEWDIVVYEARKYIALLTQGNPNVLAMLWLEPEYYIKRTAAGEMLIDNRRLFVGRHVYRAFTGYAHGQLHRMTHMAFEGYMGEKRKGIVKQFGYDCYDAETTEFLTCEGWLSFDEAKARAARLGTFKPISGELEWQSPTGFTDRPHTGSMFVIEPYSSRAYVTPNHRLVVSPCRRSAANGYSHEYVAERADWRLLPLSEILSGERSMFHIRRALATNDNDLADVPDEYLELMGLYLSEGSTNFREDGSFKSIRFVQKKPGRFFAVADELSAVYPLRRYTSDKETQWVLHGSVARSVFDDCGHGKGKRLPAWCYKLSTRQALVLWEAMMLGDGTEKPENQTLYTSVQALASDIHAMLTAAGLLAVMYGPYEFDTTHGPTTMFHVVRTKSGSMFHPVNFHRLLRSGQEQEGKAGYPIKEVAVQERRVVCFEVPNGTLITRNGGKVSFHGNCKNAAHLIRLLRMGAEFMKDGELYVKRHDIQQLLSIKRGEWTLDQVKAEADRGFKLAEEAYLASKLPAGPDFDAINRLSVAIVGIALGVARSGGFQIWNSKEVKS